MHYTRAPGNYTSDLGPKQIRQTSVDDIAVYLSITDLQQADVLVVY